MTSTRDELRMSVFTEQRGGWPGAIWSSDLRTLQRLRDGLHNLGPSQEQGDDACRWYPGYFTTVLHAVRVSPRPSLMFRNLPIRFAVCGAPAVVLVIAEGRERCLACGARLRAAAIERGGDNAPDTCG